MPITQLWTQHSLDFLASSGLNAPLDYLLALYPAWNCEGQRNFPQPGHLGPGVKVTKLIVTPIHRRQDLQSRVEAGVVWCCIADG